jgi:hypothetical protein
VRGSWSGVVGQGWRVTSIERTAYPQFKRLTSARVLHVFFTPAAEDVAWARERTPRPEALLASRYVTALGPEPRADPPFWPDFQSRL